MKKEFLIELGIAEDIAAKIMAENGKDIQREQNKFADYEDLKATVETQKTELEKLQNMKPEELQTKIADLTKQLETAQADAAAKITAMETAGKVKDYLSNKKFVNDLTKDSIANRLTEALNGDGSKGKSLEDIYSEITKDMKNIEVDDSAPKPPVQTTMVNNNPSVDDDAAVRAVMGLPPLK